MTAHTLNRCLATALGWTNITETGGSLIGTPPPGAPECRGQAKVPDWAGDWRECGPLMGEYECWPHMSSSRIFVGMHWGQRREPPRVWSWLYWATGDFAPGASIDIAMRALVVEAVCAKLAASR